jgi:hypothetical protein
MISGAGRDIAGFERAGVNHTCSLEVIRLFRAKTTRLDGLPSDFLAAVVIVSGMTARPVHVCRERVERSAATFTFDASALRFGAANRGSRPYGDVSARDCTHASAHRVWKRYHNVYGGHAQAHR